jgi:hypothetical protein
MPTFNGKEFKVSTGPDGLPQTSVQDSLASDGSPIWAQAVSITSGNTPPIDTSLLATSANQISELAKLDTLVSQLPTTIGQKTKSASTSVVLASDSDLITTTNATIGLTTDTAIVTDTTGTLSGKLRGLVKWAFERMPQSLGQTTKAGSFPVVIASDQILTVASHSSIKVSVTPTIVSTQYTTGMCVGGIQTITDVLSQINETGLFQDLVIIDRSNRNIQMDVVLYSQSPSGTFVDHAIPQPDNTGAGYILGVIKVASNEFVQIGASDSVANVAKEIQVQGTAGNRNLYAVAIVRNSATWAVGDLTFKYGVQ